MPRKNNEQDVRGSSHRSEKIRAGKSREVKEKFLEEREQRIKEDPLRPLNDKQKLYIDLIEQMPLVIATGYAGTSKTYIPTVMACDAFRLNQTGKIVFTRPATSKSKSLGHTKGGIVEKMSMWLAPVLDILVQRLGRPVLEHALARGDIVFQPLESIKGYSANNCWLIADEAEDLTIEEAETLVTRQGKNCHMILCGDLRQSDLKEKSGLLHLKNVAEQYELNIGLVDFNDPNEIVRSKACRDWVVALAKASKKDV